MRCSQTHSKKSLWADGAIRVIRIYQLVFSPDHGMFRNTLPLSRCRFYPSCSEYAVSAISQYGLLKGVVASVKRILRCAPWGMGGYDPVK